MSEPFTAKSRAVHFWGIGVGADFFLYIPFVNLILIVFTTTFELDPVKVAFALT